MRGVTKTYNTTTGATKERSYNGDYKAVGEEGEAIVLKWMVAQDWIEEIKDVRDNSEMQEKDVDFVVDLSDGRSVFVEVKTDNHLREGGNFLFEVLRINHTAPVEKAATLGWTLRSAAEIILYYSTQENKVYVWKVEDLRNVFQMYTQTARKSTKIIWVDTDRIKSTVSVLIPVSYCEGRYRAFPIVTV